MLPGQQVELIMGDLKWFFTESDFVKAQRLTVELEAASTRIAEFERILDGLPQDAIDGGWTARGISAYAKKLEGQIEALKSDDSIKAALLAWFAPDHPDKGDFMDRMRKAMDAAVAVASQTKGGL
jgi:hypothetical protein